MEQTVIQRPLPEAEHKRKRAIRLSRVLGRALIYFALLFMGAGFAMPLLWMVSTSLKTDPQVYHVPPIWFPNPLRLRNYPEMLSQYPFGVYLVNTLRYALPTSVGVMVSSALVGYSFARISWWGRDVLFFLCLATMMIPFQVTMIPLYLIFRNLGWLNSYKPLVIPTFFGNAYYIFLLRQFFLTIPQAISDAAHVDGASELCIFLRIVLPLSRPVLAVVCLFQFMGAWNNYLGPLIYLNREDLFPLALGLQQMRPLMTQAKALLWPYLMAASTCVVLPVIIIFFLAQRTFVEGITVTGLKG